jgi:hypothetical protein
LQPGEVPDNFEEMELMDAMPPTFFRDACCLADEG